MTVTKASLIDSIHNRLDLSRNKSSQLLESLLENIKKTLENGDCVMISGFGKFSVINNNGRRKIGSYNGEYLSLAKKRFVRFMCSRVFESKINGDIDSS